MHGSGPTQSPAIPSAGLAGLTRPESYPAPPSRQLGELEAELAPVRAPVRDGHRPLNSVGLPVPEARRQASTCAHISVQLEAGRRIAVRGELDIAAVAVLADLMATLVTVGPGDTTIDLAGVTFIDAAGLGYLVRLANQLADRGAKLAVVGASPRLRRVFDLVQLGGLLAAS